MDLRRIRHFTVLAETLNFSRAAERLHIAQPALSVSIQKLESELGVRLFERTSAGVRLTPGGQAGLIEARRLLHHGEQLGRWVRAAADGVGGRLRLGFVGSSTVSVLPALVRAFGERYPDVELVLREARSTRIIELLQEDGLDIGIVRTPLLQASEVALTTVLREPMVLALPQGHPLSTRPHVSVAELEPFPFIMYSATEATGLHSVTMETCQSHGFMPRVSQVATQVTTVLALVDSGLGCALVPATVRGQRAGGVLYRELSGLGLKGDTTLALACLPNPDMPAVLRFIDCAELAFRHRESSGPGR